MLSFFTHFAPENWMLLIAFAVTAVYCNWLVNVAERQKMHK
jgi:hypothetical protein